MALANEDIEYCKRGSVAVWHYEILRGGWCAVISALDFDSEDPWIEFLTRSTFLFAHYCQTVPHHKKNLNFICIKSSEKI